MLHVISWSGGKDSTATAILFKQHWDEIVKEGERVVMLFSEVMFDHKNNISGHNPDIIDFIHRAASTFTSWGFEVNILQAEKDYLDIFYHKLKRSPDPERIGLTHGFVPSGICAVKRDLKLKPIKDWLKKNKNEEIIQYIGIAIDEADRLKSLHKEADKASLLERYNCTELQARQICESYGLLSPQYQMNNGKQSRDGCWMCPNAKICEHAAIAQRYPKAWKKYVSMENEPNLAYPKWNCYTEETLHERNEKIKKMKYHQITLDEYLYQEGIKK